MATLSILGLYNYDDSIFDLMCFPDDFSQDQKQHTINNILMDCAELEVLYPDTSFIKSAIASWSFMQKSVWNRLYRAELAEYNPIENYRRHEEESTVIDETEQHSGSDSSTSTNTNTSTGSDSGTVTHSVTGYDSNQLVTQGEDETSGTSSSSDTQTGTGSVTHGEKIKHDGDNGRELLAYGNIGVTSSQDMLNQEIEIAPKLNTVNYIVNDFKNRFCILVY